MINELINFVKNLKGWQKIIGVIVVVLFVIIGLVSCKSVYLESEGTYKIIKEAQ